MDENAIVDLAQESMDSFNSADSFGSANSFESAGLLDPAISNTWSYVTPTVEQQSLDAGTVTTDADGMIVPLGTQSEVEIPQEPETGSGSEGGE